MQSADLNYLPRKSDMLETNFTEEEIRIAIFCLEKDIVLRSQQLSNSFLWRMLVKINFMHDSTPKEEGRQSKGSPCLNCCLHSKGGDFLSLGFIANHKGS